MTDTTKTPPQKPADELPLDTAPAFNPSPATAPTFDIDAAFKAAEAEEGRLLSAIENDRKSITSARARITANEQALKDVRRLLGSRTPRTRKAKK